jgi:serine/threonine protein phosphatase PrpC
MTAALTTRMGCQTARGESPVWRYAHASLVGTRHVQQGKPCEDATGARLLADGGIHLALADGVSGGALGAVAAQALVAHCVGYQGAHTLGLLHSWLHDSAEPAVQAALRQYTQEAGAATGAAAWIDADGTAIVNRIGDCRVYALQSQPASPQVKQPFRLQCLLPDQTLASQGVVSTSSLHADNPSNMVGNGACGIPEFVQTRIPIGAGLLLCSDGLHGVLSPDAIALQVQVDNLQGSCNALLKSAQLEGSTDDMSVLILYRAPPAFIE